MLKFNFNYLIFIGIVDIIIDGSLTITFNLNGITGMIIMLYIILLNIIISAIFKLCYKQLVIYANINIILAPLILYFFLTLWVSHQIEKNVDVKKFAKGVLKYELDINKVDNTYQILKVIDNDYNHLNGLDEGRLLLANDTIYLTDSKNNNKIIIYKNTMIGYPSLNDTILLKDE